jgi:LuxR family quorum-sensing system transcriptional regulator CciR
LAKTSRRRKRKTIPRATRRRKTLASAARRKTSEPRLTPRQLQCLVLVAKGRSDRQIGKTLRISEQTVHKHVEAAKKRYRVRTRIQLVVRALVARQVTMAQIVKR